MFYTNGTVFQSTFGNEFNIPKLGEDLAQIIQKFSNLIQLYDKEEIDYRKIIYETDKYIIVIIKLGEDSNLALLLDNRVTGDIKIGPIRQYLSKLEEMIDMDKEEIKNR